MKKENIEAIKREMYEDDIINCTFKPEITDKAKNLFSNFDLMRRLDDDLRKREENRVMRQ